MMTFDKKEAYEGTAAAVSSCSQNLLRYWVSSLATISNSGLTFLERSWAMTSLSPALYLSFTAPVKSVEELNSTRMRSSDEAPRC